MTRRTLERAVLYAVLIGFTVVAAYPVLWMFAGALKTEGEIATNRWGPPHAWRWDNFRVVLFESRFARYALNSLLTTTAAVTTTAVAAALAAFVFARLRFRGGTALFLLFLAGMMIPVHIVLIPLLKLFTFLGLYDTLVALALSYVAFSLPVSIIILRGFFETVPTDLVDAARIDGCSTAGVFRHVMLPLARPALAVVVIFNFVTLWNEFIFALTLLQTPDNYTIPLGLYEFSGEHSVNVPLTCAALCVAALPMLAVYAFAQKHIIKGLTSGALKG